MPTYTSVPRPRGHGQAAEVDLQREGRGRRIAWANARRPWGAETTSRRGSGLLRRSVLLARRSPMGILLAPLAAARQVSRHPPQVPPASSVPLWASNPGRLPACVCSNTGCSKVSRNKRVLAWYLEDADGDQHRDLDRLTSRRRSPAGQPPNAGRPGQGLSARPMSLLDALKPTGGAAKTDP